MTLPRFVTHGTDGPCPFGVHGTRVDLIDPDAA